ncbi:MipA/OmpV family protein [Thalassotalea sp. ND16A]|uniref:MipA/OmpV family protein n=1 Tax=Thalassotalea sp. ND16A TaxID=1535422 RepID=UPI00051A2251|nr:MipA/OmpV family protein [Thalassotalea sp. ND16A]KGJ90523.1 hypothetical protein ND16A_1919 [Thalassotalea sp. ND16A]
MKKCIYWFIWLAMLSPFAVIAAEQSIPETTEVNSWHLGVSLGYGEMISPLTDGDDIALYVMPDIRYFGEYFYLENTTLGYSLKETPNYSIDLVGLLNQDGLYFPNDQRDLIAAASPPLQITIAPFPIEEEEVEQPDIAIYPKKKSLSYMAGVAWRYRGEMDINVVLASDITAGHHGKELHANIKKQFNIGRLEFESKVGMSYKDAALVNYYYGVSEDELPFGFEYLDYRPGAAINWHVQLQLGYPISDHFWLVSSYRYDNNDSEIANSPIVAKDDFQSYFFGFKWVL